MMLFKRFLALSALLAPVIAIAPATPVRAGLGLSAEPAAPAAALVEDRAAGWWGDAPAAEGASSAGGETPTSALARMNALLRRQLEDTDTGIVFSYDTEQPSAMPTPLPTPIPTTVTTNPCPPGTFLYELALYSYQGDGWKGAEYRLEQFDGLKPQPDLVDEGTMETGSEQVDTFCLEDGTYSVFFGGGTQDSDIGIQWLPDDKQKITSCRGPCTDYFTMVGGTVYEATAPPTPVNYNQPTSFDASQTTWLLASAKVNNVNENAFQPPDVAQQVIAAAVYDVWEEGNPRMESPESVIDATVTIDPARRRQLLQDTRSAQIDLTVLMDTCAQAGYDSNDNCLASFVKGIDDASASGLLAGRLNYWADFYGMADFPGIEIDGVIADTDEWVYAPTPAPTGGGGAPSPAPTKDPASTPAPTGDDETPAPTPADPTAPTPAPSRSSSTNKKKKKNQGLSSGELIATIVCCILACLICLLCALYFKQRERHATERKDSWDISTMFTDEQNLPEDAPPAQIEGDPGDQVALADAGDATDAAGAAVAEEPQALQKITQAAEL